MFIEEDLREDEGRGRYWLKRLETHFVVKENEGYFKEFRFLKAEDHCERDKLYYKASALCHYGVQFSPIVLCIIFGAVYKGRKTFQKEPDYSGLNKRALKHLETLFIRKFFSPFEERLYSIRQVKAFRIPYFKVFIAFTFVFFIFLF
jgi:hypothetical protein